MKSFKLQMSNDIEVGNQKFALLINGTVFSAISAYFIFCRFIANGEIQFILVVPTFIIAEYFMYKKYKKTKSPLNKKVWKKVW